MAADDTFTQVTVAAAEIETAAKDSGYSLGEPKLSGLWGAQSTS